MNKSVEILNGNKIKKVTGGWGPAKLPSKKNIDDWELMELLQKLKWDFTDEEVDELRRHGYRLMKDDFGYTLLDNTGSRVFYDNKKNKERIEKILGKKSCCECY